MGCGRMPKLTILGPAPAHRKTVANCRGLTAALRFSALLHEQKHRLGAPKAAVGVLHVHTAYAAFSAATDLGARTVAQSEPEPRLIENPHKFHPFSGPPFGARIHSDRVPDPAGA